MPFKNQHPIYHVWASMRGRCHNPNNRQWADYGGRGISICQEWNSFPQFVSDMGERPPGTSIDRIDNNGDYSPSNCRWATRQEQQRNQRRAVYVTIEGVQHRAIELSEISGIKTDTIVKRAADGMSYDEVMARTRYVNTIGLPKAIAARVAKQLARTHCKDGHEFTPGNTYIRKDGGRTCRVCHNAKMRRLSAAKRLECS